MNEFKPHDYFNADDQGYISRKVFIEHVRKTYDQIRELADYIKQYEGTIDTEFIKIVAHVNEHVKQLTDLYNDLLDNNILDSEIQEKLTQLEQNYAPRLSTLEQNDVSLTAQLQQTDEKLKYHANSKSSLAIPTYLGVYSHQSTHPKVLYFHGGWNGYKYWMAHTPFPDGQDRYENPSISVSNDGINWQDPIGIVNPIDQPSSEEIGFANYMSDTDLLMRGNVMECWYRFRRRARNGLPQNDIIYKKTSTDGVNWTPREEVIATEKVLLSPSTLYEDGKYKMWFVMDNKIGYMESLDSKAWSSQIDIPLTFEKSVYPYVPWHLEVVKIDGKYSLVLSAKRDVNNDRMDLHYGVSENGLSFAVKPIIYSKPSEIQAWDNHQLYKSSLIKKGDIYELFYAASSSDNKWHIGLSSGEDIYGLKGVDTRVLYTNKQQSAYVSEKELKLTNPGVTAARFQVNDTPNTVELYGDNPQLHGRGDLVLGKLFSAVLVSNRADGYNEAFGGLSIPALNNKGIKLDILGGGHVLLNIGQTTSGAKTIQILGDNGRKGFLEVRELIIEGDASAPPVEGAIRYNPQTKKHQGHNGTSWNDLY